MPPKMKGKKGKRTEEEKENNLQSRETKCAQKLTKLQLGEKYNLKKRTPHSEDRSKSQTDSRVKPLGFWSKKLQDLEENEAKNKKHRPYEFSGTDESESSYKITKKRKLKVRSQKKRQPVMPKCNKAIPKAKELLEPEKKTEQIHKDEERKQLADEGKKFTFSTGMQSLGITSTPATAKKNNLVGASNFLFLSPIIKDDEYCSGVVECLPLKLKGVDGSPHPVHLDPGSSQVQTKLKNLSCRRVLRNGKIF